MTQKLVMIIEDDRSLLTLYQQVLKRQGYQIISASDGKEALALLEEHTPSLIFLDVRLPLVDGMQVLKHIRSRERFNETRVVVNSTLKEYGLELQNDEFLLKPIRPAVMAEIAAKTIQR